MACDEEVLSKLAKGEHSDLVDLVQYVKSQGKTEVPLNEELKVELGKSNNSYYEKEFYKTISQFCSVHQTFEAKRNVPFSINGKPADLEKGSAKDYVTNIIQSLKESHIDFKTQIAEHVALSMAELSATPYGRFLCEKEMMALVGELFKLSDPNFTPDNKAIIKVIPTEEIEKGLK